MPVLLRMHGVRLAAPPKARRLLCLLLLWRCPLSTDARDKRLDLSLILLPLRLEQRAYSALTRDGMPPVPGCGRVRVLSSVQCADFRTRRAAGCDRCRGSG